MTKSWKKWRKVEISGESWGKVAKSGVFFVGISGESWGKEGKSGKKFEKVAILDDQKSLSIAFLAISDQYATFFFLNFFQNGRRPPFWKSLLGHFGLPKITFDCISRHFRSIRNFYFFFQNGRQRPFWKSDLHQKQ